MLRRLVVTLLAASAFSCADGSTPAPTSGAPSHASASSSGPATSASPRGSASALPHASAGPAAAPPPANMAPREGDARRLIAVRPDGRAFVTARGRDAAIVALSGGTRRPLAGIEDEVALLTFSPKGDRLATVTSKLTVQVWDAETGAPLGTMPEGIADDEVDDVQFSPDGKLLAGAGRTVARIWDVGQKKKLCETSGALAFNLAFTPDQKSLVTSGVGAITRFDATTCEQKASATAKTGGTFGSWVAPDGLHVAAAGGDGHELQLFAGRDLHPVETLARSAGCTDHVNARFSRDGRVLLASGGTSWLRAFNLESLKSISAYDIPSPDRVTFALAFDDGQRALIGRGATVELVSLPDKKVAFTFPLEGAETVELSWDQKRLLGATKQKVLVWDTANGKLLETFDFP